MKNKFAYLIILLPLFYTYAYSQMENFLKNDLMNVCIISDIQIGPEKQQIIINFGGFVTFQLKNLDGCQSARIEYKELLSNGGFQTITGFGNISSIGTYTKTAAEIFNQLGIGIFLWRVSDNIDVNHISSSKILIVILNP